MLKSFFKPAPKPEQPRIVEVGWALTENKASLIWDDPKPFTRDLRKPSSAKSVQVCPAAIDFDARHCVIPCPVDLHMKFAWNDKKEPLLVNVEGPQSTIRPKHLNNMISIVSRNEWRDLDKPIIQIITPYIFLSDEQVYLNQTAPYLHYLDQPWPGVLIGGRFPIQVWPRGLMWAFEWHDTSKEINIKRGDPWFYVRFESDDPSRPIRIIEADLVPDTQKYLDGISGVTNYVNRTFSLFERAKRRRPTKLLFAKK